MPAVITAGETMILGVPSRPGRLRHSPSLELKIGGAESNVAIALSRLGVSAGWVGYLSADETGQLVLDRVRGEGVDTSRVRRLEGYATGLYLRDNLGAKVRVYYYRKDSAASRMAPGAFDAGYLDGARFVHLTGITPALSSDCGDFVLWVVKEARTRGVDVSFDVNYRSKLWRPEEARAFLEEALPGVDLLFLSADEALAIWGREDEGLLRELADAGPGEVVLRRGRQGARALAVEDLVEQPAFLVSEVDPVGAGDAFVAGYLAGRLWNLSLEERLRVANAMGAFSVMTLGDYEGLPDEEELWAFVEGKGALGR